MHSVAFSERMAPIDLGTPTIGIRPFCGGFELVQLTITSFTDLVRFPSNKTCL